MEIFETKPIAGYESTGYVINTEGVIFDKNKKEVQLSHDAKSMFVSLVLQNPLRIKQEPVEKLMLNTFSPLKDIKEAGIYRPAFKNLSTYDCRLSNLYWKKVTGQANTDRGRNGKIKYKNIEIFKDGVSLGIFKDIASAAYFIINKNNMEQDNNQFLSVKTRIRLRINNNGGYSYGYSFKCLPACDESKIVNDEKFKKFKESILGKAECSQAMPAPAAPAKYYQREYLKSVAEINGPIYKTIIDAAIDMQRLNSVDYDVSDLINVILQITAAIDTGGEAFGFKWKKIII